MKLENLLAKFTNYYFFGEDMQDDEHCVWAYDLENCIYLQFSHTGNKCYDLELVEHLPATQINERFLADARNFRPLK